MNNTGDDVFSDRNETPSDGAAAAVVRERPFLHAFVAVRVRRDLTRNRHRGRTCLVAALASDDNVNAVVRFPFPRSVERAQTTTTTTNENAARTETHGRRSLSDVQISAKLLHVTYSIY